MGLRQLSNGPAAPAVRTDGLVDGSFGNDSLVGTDGNDTIYAYSGQDTLFGGAGDDWLWGGAGVDRVDGGAGVDTVFFLDGTQGVVANLATGVATNDGFGNAESIVNVEDAHGTSFADRITVGVGDSKAFGWAGNDTLIGGAGNNKFWGGSGADSIVGGAGFDEMAFSPDGIDDAGWSNFDTAGTPTRGLVVDLTAGTIIDGWGATDRVSSIEWITGSDFADTMTGDGVANLLVGDPGNDTLTGLGGNDTLIGADGSDSLVGGDGDDGLVGDDIPAGVNSGSDTLLGGGGNDTLIGGEGNDSLVGGSGSDTLQGGNGNDTYVVDGGETIAEAGTVSSALDTVRSSVAWTLGDNLERLVLTGSGAVRGTGNGLANTLTGNSGANLLSGGSRNDTLSGGAGNDTLIGGTGNDSLTGGAGLDAFRFTGTLTASNVDRVNAFVSADDVMQLDDAVFAGIGAPGALAAGAFRLGAAAGDANDRVIYNATTGQLFFDADGSGATAQVLFATVAAGTSIVAADFVIV